MRSHREKRALQLGPALSPRCSQGSGYSFFGSLLFSVRQKILSHWFLYPESACNLKAKTFAAGKQHTLREGEGLGVRR